MGDNILILSDRGAGPDRAPIPALLAVAAVHHHLVREGTRLRCGLVVESGEPREVHHLCCLLGYGASAINPYLAFETLTDMFDGGLLAWGRERGRGRERTWSRPPGKGILKTISKMGISTVRSYSGAQIFEAVGLERAADRPLLHRHDVADRRDRPRRAGDRDARPPPPRLPGDAAGAGRGDPACRRGPRLAPRRRAPPVEPGHDRSVQHAVREGGQEAYERYTRAGQRRVEAPRDPARPAQAQGARRADPDRGGRAGQGDRQALRHRRDVARLAVAPRRTRRSRSR